MCCDLYTAPLRVDLKQDRPGETKGVRADYCRESTSVHTSGLGEVTHYFISFFITTLLSTINYGYCRCDTSSHGTECEAHGRRRSQPDSDYRRLGRLLDDDHTAASTGADPTCYTPTFSSVDTRSFNRRTFD